uniref:Integrase catalytic domain-containing protein n=1 Tax=Tanacetum cinerariifolium TaxID=118510 RepID=A0A699GYZ8_TANCI|nr:hypothetical protein [Tanacetum cinerariifolium]
MLGLLDMHWSLKFARLTPGFLLTIQSRCVALKAFHCDAILGQMYYKFQGNQRDDYDRFTWVFFLATKDETSGYLKSFITRIENLVDHKVKVIRFDNETELKNKEMNQFYEMKGILRQFSVARTPQQNGVAERRNMTLIKAARTITPTLSFMRPFGCPVTILNTIDHLGKFDGKVDEGFFVGYSMNNKAFRVFNSRTRIVEENLHISFSESTSNVIGSGPDWLFEIDALTRIMNYEQIVAGTQSNGFTDPTNFHDDGSNTSSDDGKKVDEDRRKENECNDQEKEDNVNNTNNVSSIINTAGTNGVNVVDKNISIELLFDPNMPALEDVRTFDFSSNGENNGAVADINNLNTIIQGSRIPTTRIHKDHPLDQVIGDLHSATQTRKMSKNLEEHRFEELLQFKLQDVWTLVDLLNGKKAIGTKWDFRNKRGLQVKLKKDGRFISQDKYVVEILKKFRYIKVKTTSIPMETQKPLLKDEDGEEVDVHMYRYHVNPKISDLYAIKRIFRYLKGQPKLGLWYPKDSPFDLVAYTDSDYARASLDSKFTTGDGKEIVITESSVRRDLQLADEEGIDCLPNSTIFKQLALMGPKTTAWNEFNSIVASERKSDAINADDEITLVNDTDNGMFRMDDLGGEDVFFARNYDNVVEEVVNVAQVSTAATTTTITTEEITSAQALEALKTLKTNVKGIVFQEPEDEIWKMQQGYKVLDWKLYDSCRVHSLMMQSMKIYMLVEKKYPLTPPTLLMMLEKKLQIDCESEMAYQLFNNKEDRIETGSTRNCMVNVAVVAAVIA